MIVVSDTTAVTTLLKAGEERLLQLLFNEVLVAQAVWDELRAFHTRLPHFVLLRPVAAPGERLPGTEHLGHGEADAIKLAKEVAAALLLTDDRKARDAAAKLGINAIGLLGVALQARKQKHIESGRVLVETLETKGGLYLSDEVKAEAMKLAGEDIAR